MTQIYDENLGFGKDILSVDFLIKVLPQDTYFKFD